MEKIFFLVSLMLLAFGCAETEDLSAVRDIPETRSSQVFEAVIDASTRVSFDGYKRAWESGDQICISDGSVNAICEISELNDGIATFKPVEGQPVLNMASTNFTAVYPADIMDGGIKSSYIAAPGDETSLIPMGAVSKNAKLTFRNLCALVKVSVSTDSPDILINQLSITTDAPVCGPFTIKDAAAVMASEGLNTISLNSVDGIPVGAEPTVLYLSVPPGEYGEFTVTLRTTGGIVKVFPMKDESIVLERNKVYSKSVVANGLDVCDFREEGNANCYIASAKGKYRFAAVKPDGTSVGNISSADVYWSYDNTNMAPEEGSIISKVSYSDGVIDFVATEKQGNALIAAYDANGTVLWSWHIWRTNELPGDVVTANGAVMDRYVGALDATPGSLYSIGLMYQYGRKDPFPGRVGTGNIQGVFQGNEYREEEGPVDMLTAIRNPSVRYYGTDSNFWTTAEARADAEWDGDRKTVNDPCPYGYRVPANTVFGATDKASLTKLFVWDSSNMGFVYDGGKAWYPTTGQLAPKGKSMNSGTAISFSWSRNRNTNGNPIFLDLRNNTINGYGGGAAAAAGFALRCQKVSENQ